jgi:hypothetical protein
MSSEALPIVTIRASLKNHERERLRPAFIKEAEAKRLIALTHPLTRYSSRYQNRVGDSRKFDELTCDPTDSLANNFRVNRETEMTKMFASFRSFAATPARALTAS